MKKILDALFSMQLTVVLLLMFAISAGVATFIENDFGTIAAKVAVYNATWFEVLLVLLAVNLGGSLVVNRMWQKKKYTIFIFHISFIIILVGAAITRYHGFEGMMHIREGESSGEIVSTRTYITAKLPGGEVERQHVLMSGTGWHAPDFSVDVSGGDIEIETIDFVPNAAVVISQVIEGEPIVSMFAMTKFGRQNLVLKENDVRTVDDLTVTFSDITGPNTINLSLDNEQLMIMAPDTIFITTMGSEAADTILPGVKRPFNPMQLYGYRNSRLVLRKFEPSGRLRPVPASRDNSATGLDALLVEISRNDDTEETILWGTRGIVGDFTTAEVGGDKISLSYGSVPIELPFRIRLNEFILDRYPGSNSPSSYASEVTLIDEERNETFDFRIYMNHILTHRGYRFYQSSYDTDEQGTILSVNHDAPGTIVSYIGYAIMAAGMIFSLVSRKTRFRKILRMISETRAKKTKLLSVFLFLATIVPQWGFSAPAVTERVNGIRVNVPEEGHAEEFGRLIVLSTNNRLEPLNTLSSKLLRKFTGKNTFEGLNADQVFLGIISEPGVWQNVPMLKVKNKELRDMLNIDGKYASFSDFFDFQQHNTYKLGRLVEEAYQKKSIDQTKFDKEVINADEKVNIFYLLYSGSYLKLFPKPGAPAEKWYAPSDDITGVAEGDSNFIKNIIPMYIETLAEAYQTGDYSQANELVTAIDMYQQKYAAEILPPERRQNIEILYNKVEIFERLFKYYGLLGVVFLLIIFLQLIFPKLRVKEIRYGIIAILTVLFIFQTLGIAARWYISGHAPLSNGFESMIFIAWATMLAGFLLARRSAIALAATTVLASLTLFVAHLNWMNPEVTNLVPVLKSVWLTIHVAIITSSYGFLGLGMILGLFNLFLMIFQNRNNLERFNLTIREISLTAEATMTIGLYMLTIGTFLGGVWANESWGRYWGWDPKETWALVTVLVYAVIIHMNFIPGMMGRYLFNSLAVIGFSSVLMTYFGVNYYLSGLHSYAAGDPVPIPTFVYYTIAALVVLLIIAYFNNQRIDKIMLSQKRK